MEPACTPTCCSSRAWSSAHQYVCAHHTYVHHTRWYVVRGTAIIDLLAIGPLPLELALWLCPNPPPWWLTALPLALMMRLARLVHVWKFLVDAQFNSIQLYRGLGLINVLSPTTLLLGNLAFTTATVVCDVGVQWLRLP